MSEGSGSHAYQPGSWVAVAIIFIGFVVGGVALCLGPLWIMLWVGVGIVVVGLLVSWMVHLFADVVVDAPRVIPEIVDYSLFGSRSASAAAATRAKSSTAPSPPTPKRPPRLTRPH